MINITTIGDSITQAGAGHNSYRSDLWYLLTDTGYNIDFVGSQNTTNDGNAFPDSSFDPDHEGHWGWRTDEINNGRNGEGSLPDWLTGYTPDIALIHLGSADLFQLQSAESTIDDLRETINILRADNPDIVIFLAQLIPTTDSDRNQSIDAFNAQLPALVAEVNQSASPVILVDQNSGFEASQDTFDGIHPNASGEAKMAQKWFEAIDSYLIANGITPESSSESPTSEPTTANDVNVIEGTPNNDTLEGTNGDDRLIGYLGIDNLTGNDGNDVFILGDETGGFYDQYEWQDFATITDFAPDEDTIVLSGTAADYTFTNHES